MWKFIKSASCQDNWLSHDKKEFCFIGRSNVGKSSLINALSKNKKLAKTSKMPGRTQLINYFSNDEDNIVVDLPGYGYANISIEEQEKMFSMIDEYFLKNKPFVVFLLIDSRVGITKKDDQIINHLLDLKHNVVLIITKCDKATQKELSTTLKNDFFKKLHFFKSSIYNEKQIMLINNFMSNK